MPHLRALQNIAAGMTGWFASRNNGIEFYWALGVLYSEAPADGVITFDLARAQVQPATPVTASMLNTCIARLNLMLAKQGFTRTDFASASIAIAFGSGDVLAHPVFGGEADGDPYRCAVTITDRRGRVHQASHLGRCRRQDPTRDTRSGG